MADIIQIRRGTAAQWASTNPVLADGELGFETDTKKGKLGNGVAAWAALPYSFTGEVPGTVAEQITAATAKTTPVDADLLGIVDSAASNVLKKLTWANLKATLKTYLDTLYATIAHNHSTSDITSGTLGVARGGTGIDSFTIGNFISASGATTLQQRTPDQVRSDIGAEAAFSKGSLIAGTNITLSGTLANRLVGTGDITVSASGGGDVAGEIVAASDKATPVDADLLGLVDSAALNVLKKLTWANVKVTLKTYFDTLYATVSHTQNASTILAGTFGAGNFVFPNNLKINGQVGGGYIDKFNSGNTLALNWNEGNTQKFTLNGDCVVSFSNPVEGSVYKLLIGQNGTGGWACTLPAIRWKGGTAPVITPTANKVDYVELVYDGFTYFGKIDQNY